MNEKISKKSMREIGVKNYSFTSDESLSWKETLGRQLVFATAKITHIIWNQCMDGSYGGDWNLFQNIIMHTKQTEGP